MKVTTDPETDRPVVRISYGELGKSPGGSGVRCPYCGFGDVPSYYHSEFHDCAEYPLQKAAAKPGS